MSMDFQKDYTAMNIEMVGFVVLSVVLVRHPKGMAPGGT